jgi:hypothetical protein
MADLNEKLNCPLCSGHGELFHDELEEFLKDPKWQERLMLKYREQVEALQGGVKAQSAEANQTFSQKVHNWNPRMPIWTRSPKE